MDNDDDDDDMMFDFGRLDVIATHRERERERERERDTVPMCMQYGAHLQRQPTI